MPNQNLEQQFEVSVIQRFRFLEEIGYIRCSACAPKVDPRDAFRRIRYYSSQATIDVELTIGLGLFAHIYVGSRSVVNPCEADLGHNAINVETLPSKITLPFKLQIRKCKTLYEGYKHIFTYQKVVAEHFESAIFYLGEKTREVENQLIYPKGRAAP